MAKTKNSIVSLIISVIGIFTVAFGIALFNGSLLLTFPLGIRMVLMIVSQWMLFFVPGIMMLISKEGLHDLGFTRKALLKQICIGVFIALGMSAVLTVLPIMLGFKEMVSSTRYTQIWQFLYQFAYAILGVALAEELIFRGYLFNTLLKIKNSRWFAIIVSSVLFGLFHVFSGNPVQIITTAIIGLLYCICREKIKDCTIVSLIIAHGVYDALIILWASIL